MGRHEPVLAAVASILSELDLCPAGATPIQTVLVAVSGGPDSICLVDALSRLVGWRPDDQRATGRAGIKQSGKRSGRFAGQLHLAHLHHGLRGAAADEDAEFVQARARDYGWPATIGRIDAKREAVRLKLSLQAAARECRYRFLKETADRVGAAWIAVAHTANDQAETLLLRLLRGSGPDGLAGMPLVRDARIVRPLLRVTREAVIEYLTRRERSFRLDRSNEDRHYTRNRIRAELLPLLARDYNPAIVSRLAATARLMAEERQLVDDLLAGHWREGLLAAEPGRLIFDRGVIGRLPAAVQRWWLRRALRVLAGGPAGSAKACDEVLRGLDRPAPRTVMLRGGVTIKMTETTIDLKRANRPSIRTARVGGK
ncbi:MAG TPA: tRNA lysidine(34) synthetase TilS [Nitrospiria bacterium]|nr:tRNA lysidine(34) synthetase TilS [Nitrospiria bacterium]